MSAVRWWIFTSILLILVGRSHGVAASVGVYRLETSATVHQWGGTESADIVAPWKWHTKVAVANVVIADEQKRLGQSMAVGALGFGLPGRFELQLALPAGGTFQTFEGNGTTGGGVGDLRLGILYQLKKAPQGGVGLLAGVFSYFPTGQSEHLLGEGTFSLYGFAALQITSFSSALTVNIGYLSRAERHGVLRNGSLIEQDDDLLWRVALRIPKDEDIAWSLTANGAVGVATDEGFWPSGKNRTLWLGGGIDYPVAKNRRVGLFSAVLIGKTDAGFQFGVQISGLSTDQDEDRDGVLKKWDQCPLLREDRDGFMDGDGCPDPDNDMDSFPDDEDACPLKRGDGYSVDGC